MGRLDVDGAADLVKQRKLLELWDRAGPDEKDFILLAAVSVVGEGVERLALAAGGLTTEKVQP